MTEKRQQEIYIGRNFSAHVNTYLSATFLNFHRFSTTIKNDKKKIIPVSQLNKNRDLLYNSKLGICSIHKVSKLTNEQYKLALIRSAFSFDIKEKQHLFLRNFKKNVVIVDYSKTN